MKDKYSLKKSESDNGAIFNHNEPAYTIIKGDGKWQLVRVMLDPELKSASSRVEVLFDSINKAEVVEQFKIFNGKILQRCLNESL